MPSFSVGFAQVEERLRSVRRRLNLLIVQDALYRSGSALAAAAILLMGLAVWRGVSISLDVGWIAGAAVAATAGAAALRAHRRWLSVEEVVHFADRRAELDDRLATLLLDPPRLRTSTLHTVLLEQILAAAPRWDVDILAPRRVPRSLYVLAAALGALIVTAYFARPPARPAPATAMLHPQHGADTGANAHSRAAEASRSGGAQGQGASAVQRSEQAARSDGNGAGRAMAGADDASGRRGEEGAGEIADGRADGTSNGRSDRRSADALGRADSGTHPHPAESASAATTRRDDSAANAANRNAADGAGTDARGIAPSTEQARATDPSSGGDGTGTRREQTGSAPAAPRSTDGRPLGTTGNRPGSGSAPASGGLGGGAGGLFAAAPEPSETRGGSTRPVPVELGAFSTVAPSRSDPQRPDPASGVLPNGSAHQPVPLPDEQIPDAPLQKADIAPEHEPLIRRIFTPDE